MAILKCKMCGGDLNITAEEKIVECEFCGTTQTIPDGSDEKKTNLFNRANRLRIANEFDKAAGIYESIIAEFPDEAESYWGLCLCKFGIEYVDDPKTAKKIPTCHRTSFESIFDDENYKMAIEKSDVIAQGVYKEEANVIDNLQKDILSIVHKEDPFDVFICYKETDELGQRTQDSVLAQDIYDALTDKGFKVFFSRITLENKLGKQYEPYIFAALNSAKVMLAIGTKEEYYNSVWVKNEWSRFLALMEIDKSKMLIPCYRDIDPYDMPQEFKNLQGQDMSKLGFIQDLVRGIIKIVGDKGEIQNDNGSILKDNPYTDRGFLALEDCDYKKADEFFEQALNLDAKCAMAYVGKLLAELYLSSLKELLNYSEFFANYNGDGKVNGKYITIEQLKNQGNVSIDEKFIVVHRYAFGKITRIDGDISKKPNFQKAVRFADSGLRIELEDISKKFKERYDYLRHKQQRDRKKEKDYKAGCEMLELKTPKSLKKAIVLFEGIEEYKDSKSKVDLCRKFLVELEESRILDILKCNDVPLSARQIRDSVTPQISQTQTRLETLSANKKVEAIKQSHTTKYCIYGYEERKKCTHQLEALLEEIKKLDEKHKEKLPEELEAEKVYDEIVSLQEKKDKLSLFNVKEKKKIQSDIDELTQRHNNIINNAKSKRAEVDNQHSVQRQKLIEQQVELENKIKKS